MYSNNILNFLESMTILNACTKKVWKLIEGTSSSVGANELILSFFPSILCYYITDILKIERID